MVVTASVDSVAAPIVTEKQQVIMMAYLEKPPKPRILIGENVTIMWQGMFVGFVFMNPASVPVWGLPGETRLLSLLHSSDPSVTLLCGNLLKTLEPTSVASLLPHGSKQTGTTWRQNLKIQIKFWSSERLLAPQCKEIIFPECSFGSMGNWRLPL